MVDLKVVYKAKALLFFWCGPLAVHDTRKSGCENTQGTHTHTHTHTWLQVTKVKVKLKHGNVRMLGVPVPCFSDSLLRCVPSPLYCLMQRAILYKTCV